MAYFNKVVLMGNLTREPELRYTSSGSPVCEFGIAISRKVKDKEEVCFIDVSAWGKIAENCGKYLTKGAAVLIDGHLIFQQWQDRNGGGKRSKLSVTADSIQFMGSGIRKDSRGMEHSRTETDGPPPPPLPEAPEEIQDDIPF